MEQPSIWHDQWTNVDRVSDPAFFVRFLDLTRAAWIQRARADPQAFYAFLDIQAGHQILDVGCGTGDLLRPLAEVLDPTSRIVGVDNSELMIQEAIKRVEGCSLPVEYRVGEAHALDFADASFHRCYANFVFMHLERPRQALTEMIRVARSGAMIVIDEADWDTQVIDADNLLVTRKLVHFISDSIIRNGCIARQLPGLFRVLGLQDVAVVGLITQWPHYASFAEWWLKGAIERALQAGIVSTEEITPWIHDLETRSHEGRFFTARTIYRVAGRKP